MVSFAITPQLRISVTINELEPLETLILLPRRRWQCRLDRLATTTATGKRRAEAGRRCGADGAIGHELARRLRVRERSAVEHIPAKEHQLLVSGMGGVSMNAPLLNDLRRDSQTLRGWDKYQIPRRRRR
jgi:hypothetical protein